MIGLCSQLEQLACSRQQPVKGRRSVGPMEPNGQERPCTSFNPPHDSCGISRVARRAESDDCLPNKDPEGERKGKSKATKLEAIAEDVTGARKNMVTKKQSEDKFKEKPE